MATPNPNHDGTIRDVKHLVSAQKTSDGAGVKLYRSIGSFAFQEYDPFLLLDEFKSDRSDDYIAGFPNHPHRGFETVTYMLAGEFEHKDSTGEQGILTEGCVQWMTAGRGIVHSEMPIQKSGLVHGFQLWINLPAKNKMQPPQYQNLTASQIPEYRLEGGIGIKSIAGELHGLSGAIHQSDTEPIYLDVTVPRGSIWNQALPPEHHVLMYVFDGTAIIGGGEQEVAAGNLAVLGNGQSIKLTARSQSTRVLLLAGKPLNEPIVRHGPFVMNCSEEIEQAIQDYQNGTF